MDVPLSTPIYSHSHGLSGATRCKPHISTGILVIWSNFQNYFQFGKWIKILKMNKNIARGTTDPEIDSVTWIQLGNDMAPLTLVANLATRWRHLH